MKSILFTLAVWSLPLIAQSSSPKLDCTKLMKSSWNSTQRGAAQADCEFYNASVEREGDAWGDFAALNASLPRGKGKDEIRAAYKKTYTDPSFRLSWHPERAEEVGSTYVVTSGPYEVHRQVESKDQGGHGLYITVWQQQSDGSWRFVWDGGEEIKERK